MKARFIISEVGIGLRRNLTMTFAVIITVAISLSLLGIGLLSNSQFLQQAELPDPAEFLISVHL